MKFLLPILSTFLLFSCLNEEGPHDELLPEANGQHGEILILMEDNLWNGDLGQTVKDQLSIRAEGRFLRPEPMFNFYQQAPKDLSHLTQLSRNILKFMIDTDSTYAETAVIEKTNYYAKHQLFVIVKDSDANRLMEFAKNEMRQIIDLFNDFELAQLMAMYREDSQPTVSEIVTKKFGIGISVPDDFGIKSETDSFLLIKRDRSKNLMGNDATNAEGGTFWIQQGVMFWSDKYEPDSSQLTVKNVLLNRDSTLKYNVPGSVKGTYMGTEYSEYYDPIGREFSFKGHKAVEVRGLWIYNGSTFLGGGGPFVQYSILNESKNEIITVCGYVYGPGYEKREYVRELDAMLQTIDLNP